MKADWEERNLFDFTTLAARSGLLILFEHARGKMDL